MIATQTLTKLEEAKEAARREYERLSAPADQAYNKFKIAAKALNEAKLYEKAKRQVMRDLLNTAGAKM